MSEPREAAANAADSDGTNAGGHLSDDVLADYDAELLDPDAVARVDEHLPGCPDCSERLDAVRRVGVLLAAAPVPTMPDDVFARLHHSVTALVDAEHGNADYPDDPDGRPRIELDTGAADYADHPRSTLDPDRQPDLSQGEVESRAAGIGPDSLTGSALPASIDPATVNPGWSRPTMGKLEQSAGRRRRRLPVIVAAALGTCGLAAVVGFGGYLVSAVSGHNEPVADPPLVVESGNLGASAGVADRSGLSAHRFSDAWNCARQVTSGRITGIRASVLDGRSGYLVFLAGPDDSTRVVFVSGCGTTPTAGPSTTIPGR